MSALYAEERAVASTTCVYPVSSHFLPSSIPAGPAPCPCRRVPIQAAFAYTEPVSTLITRFKYQASLQHGSVLGTLLLEQLRKDYRTQPLPDLLIPVPLHPVRLRERGFNQALVLARQLGEGLQIPVAHNLLERVRQTQPQQGLSARERKRNLRRAFRLQHAAIPESCNSVALIDDVVTTMSTVHELARVLRHDCTHNLEVHVWCIARA